LKIEKYGAKWCAPCKQQRAILERVSDYTKVPYVDIDVEEHPEKAMEIGITSIPVTVIYDDRGKVIKKLVGIVSEDKLLDILV